jgi:hypothetical protein
MRLGGDAELQYYPVSPLRLCVWRGTRISRDCKSALNAKPPRRKDASRMITIAVEVGMNRG